MCSPALFSNYKKKIERLKDITQRNGNTSGCHIDSTVLTDSFYKTKNISNESEFCQSLGIYTQHGFY